MFFDPLYFLFVGPAMLLAMWAQWKVKSSYAHAAKIGGRSGMTGAQAAARLMQVNGIGGIGIEAIAGKLTDHYDPRRKVIALSEGVYGGQSLAALGIAAHECGHAIQDHSGYAPLVIRNGIVPLAAVGGNLSMLLMLAGFVIGGAGSVLGGWLIWVGIGLFSLTVIFQLVNLPVEFNASSRAKAQLVQAGIIASDELPEVRRVLSAAAMTYVAATLTAVLTLAYFLLRAQSRSGR